MWAKPCKIFPNMKSFLAARSVRSQGNLSKEVVETPVHDSYEKTAQDTQEYAVANNMMASCVSVSSVKNTHIGWNLVCLSQWMFGHWLEQGLAFYPYTGQCHSIKAYFFTGGCTKHNHRQVQPGTLETSLPSPSLQVGEKVDSNSEYSALGWSRTPTCPSKAWPMSTHMGKRQEESFPTPRAAHISISHNCIPCGWRRAWTAPSTRPCG